MLDPPDKGLYIIRGLFQRLIKKLKYPILHLESEIRHRDFLSIVSLFRFSCPKSVCTWTEIRKISLKIGSILNLQKGKSLSLSPMFRNKYIEDTQDQ